MHIKKLLLILPAILLLSACNTGKIKDTGYPEALIDGFETCLVAGYPAMESFPRQCKTADGRTFVEQIDLPSAPKEISCTNAGGNWLAEFSECEYVSKEWCDKNGGQFKECESACRNDPDAEICTLQCEIVCQL